MTFICRRWPGIPTNFPQRYIPGRNGTYGSEAWHRCTRWNWWTGRCPLTPIFGHVAEEQKRRKRLGRRGRKVEDEDGDRQEGKRVGLRYRVPTRLQEEAFARAAIAAAASVGAYSAARPRASGQKAAGGGLEPIVGKRVLKEATLPDFLKTGLLALAIASALTGAHEMLVRSGRAPSLGMAGPLEKRLSLGLQSQLSSRPPARGGMAYQFNWAASLRTLLGSSRK